MTIDKNLIAEVVSSDADLAVFTVWLNPVVCDALLDLSGDENVELHHSEHFGVAQGLVVWMALGTCISKWKPSRGPFTGDFAFEGFAKVGEVVTVRLMPGEKVKTIICEIINEAGVVFKATTKLANGAGMLRAAKMAARFAA